MQQLHCKTIMSFLTTKNLSQGGGDVCVQNKNTSAEIYLYLYILYILRALFEIQWWPRGERMSLEPAKSAHTLKVFFYSTFKFVNRAITLCQKDVLYLELYNLHKLSFRDITESGVVS